MAGSRESAFSSIETRRAVGANRIGGAILWIAFALGPICGASGLESVVESKLIAPDGERGDQFGWAVAVDGQVLAVGAVNAADVGAVYVFERTVEVWEEVATLRPEGDAPNLSFGNAVDVEGDTLIVGAPRDREGAEDVGAAYVFRHVDGLWQMQARLIASDGRAGDRFGESVSVRGERVVVGAPGRSDPGENAGAVYVFVEADDSWSEEAMLMPSEARTGDLFGTAVAAGSGLIVAGAPTDTTALNAPGSAYVFELESESWVQRARLRGSGSQRDQFGISVAVEGPTIVVGSPRTANDLPERPGGSVHLFEQVGSRWTEQARLEPPAVTPGDRFGFSVSISGGTMVASAVDRCSIHAFRRAGVAWRHEATIMARDGCQAAFGRAVAVRRGTIVVGTPSDGENGIDAGAMYVYEESDRTVILGPGRQVIVTGEEAEIYLSFNNRLSDVVSLRFESHLPTELRLDADGLGSVDCRLEEDLADDHVLNATLFSDPTRLEIELTSLLTTDVPLPRDGLFARCPARVDREAEPGSRPLSCNEKAPASAMGVDGTALATRCEGGELIILPPCRGDCDGSGSVSVDEVLVGIRVALDTEPIESCIAVDRDRNGFASVDELVGAVSAALFGCRSQ